METIRGKKSLELDLAGFKKQLSDYDRVLLDLGTGDGRYARTFAQARPDWFIIGVDACRENLLDHSQAKLRNLLFVIASAQALPRELDDCASQLTINFPWGSLLESLLAGDHRLMRGLESISRGNGSLELRLNGGALAEAGTVLDAGTEKIHDNLRGAGWQTGVPVVMDAQLLRRFPSTWAKRLAFGRDPRAIMLSAHK